MGNFIYTKDGLQYHFVDGYVEVNDVSYFHYYIKNHLGSNRIVADKNGNIEQKTNYYAYGGIIGDISTNPETQKYNYNGKEYETMYGLNTYDYGARQYDPARITWDRMDQLCEEKPWNNPYVYCVGNPVLLIDLFGLTDYNPSDARANWTNFDTEKDQINLNEIIVTPTTHKPDYTAYFNSLVSLETINLNIKAERQYSNLSKTWLATNGKIYSTKFNGNKYVGSRSKVKKKAGTTKKIGKCGTSLNMYLTAEEYLKKINDPTIGPNLKQYYKEKLLRLETVNAIGFAGFYGEIFSTTYNVLDIIKLYGYNLQYNPYTHDFTPIEETLKLADENNIRLYY